MILKNANEFEQSYLFVSTPSIASSVFKCSLSSLEDADSSLSFRIFIFRSIAVRCVDNYFSYARFRSFNDC